MFPNNGGVSLFFHRKKRLNLAKLFPSRDALEQYTRSERNIKEIICQKQVVGWNFQELQDKIRAIIYSTGYRSYINVVSYLLYILLDQK